MYISKLWNKFIQFLIWIGGIGNSPSDSAELRSNKIILVVAGFLTILNLWFFAVEYLRIGRETAALALIIQSIYFLIILIIFRLQKNFSILRDMTFIGMYIYIVIYHTLMGGYIKSVSYIMYGIPILNGVQMFYKQAAPKYFWYFLYMTTAIVLYFLEPIISQGVEPLSNNLVVLTLLNNFILISTMVMLSIIYFNSIIKKEKEKSDTLIRNILPNKVVYEINKYGKSDPILVDNATVIFMDFVGFTKITKSKSPRDLVSILNNYFTAFDKKFKKHNVEKLKTIGDGYMAVGGLPIQNTTHSIDVALAAMEILKYMEESNVETHLPWNLRIGIHTGPVVAGIIGESKFSYDVWGNTVNITARLETAGKSGFINVSKEFMEATSDFFDFTHRGIIEIKNSDPIDMYFLDDIKAVLRESHFTPNEQFKAQYEKLQTTV